MRELFDFMEINMIVYIFFRAKGAEIGYNLHSVMQKKTSYQ